MIFVHRDRGVCQWILPRNLDRLLSVGVKVQSLLEVRNLQIEIQSELGSFLAVNNVSFEVHKGEILGIVGESGCGKSVTSLSILKLLGHPLRVVNGELLFKGENLINSSDRRIREIRGHQIAMIFQEPMTSLNPVFTCGEQIAEAIVVHQPELSKGQVKQKVLEALNLVGIADPVRRYSDFPHQLSGGMRQRVMIAMALSCDPELLIADEPTTALDVTIQAQILTLIRNIQREKQSSTILITHDLGVIAEMCDRVVVMYAGKIVEVGTVDEIFFHGRHPYTKGLLESIPKFSDSDKKIPLKPIPGLVPSVFELTIGCRFYDRCEMRTEKCKQEEPQLTSGSHSFACFNPLSEEKGVHV